MVPTIGRIVHYRLNDQDASRINRRRGVAALLMHSLNDVLIHEGNDVRAGDTYPMMITRVSGDQPDSYVNGQVMLDGNDLHWVTSVKAGEGPHTFSWPPRV